MWNDSKLNVAVVSEQARLDQLNTQKESFAAKGQWGVVKALKLDILVCSVRLKAYKDVLESDE